MSKSTCKCDANPLETQSPPVVEVNNDAIIKEAEKINNALEYAKKDNKLGVVSPTLQDTNKDILIKKGFGVRQTTWRGFNYNFIYWPGTYIGQDIDSNNWQVIPDNYPGDCVIS